MNFRARTTLAVLLISTLPAYGNAPASIPAQNWPDAFTRRVEAMALLQTLNAQLLSNDSATATLERWCAVHQLTAQPRIVAERVPGIEKPPTAEQRRDLGVPATVPVHYRRVRLLCGTTVLSEADNWYLPGRLTPEMNEMLDTTNTPFGRAVQGLHFQRHTISARLLWQPLPESWEMSADTTSEDAEDAESVSVPAHVLEHRAVLTLPDGTPFSEVVETYTRNVLAFPCPCLPEVSVVARRPQPPHAGRMNP
jgi:chorismate-pyruvate lyase